MDLTTDKKNLKMLARCYIKGATITMTAKFSMETTDAWALEQLQKQKEKNGRAGILYKQKYPAIMKTKQRLFVGQKYNKINFLKN